MTLIRVGTRSITAAVVGLCLAVPAWGTEYFSRDEWPAIQRGIQVTQYSRVAGVVNEFDRSPESSIVILYPGGEAGYDWATEIHDWFVALGVPSRRIALRPGSGVPGSIGLQVEDAGSR